MIKLSMICVLTELKPPKEIFAYIFSYKVFFSIKALELSTNKIPYLSD